MPIHQLCRLFGVKCFNKLLFQAVNLNTAIATNEETHVTALTNLRHGNLLRVDTLPVARYSAYTFR